MTSPKHAKTTARGRQYINPVTGQTYPSVTTILGQIGKGDALKWWAAGEVAKYAVEMRNTWLELDPQAAIDLLKREPLRSLNRAADRGTDVHAIADRYAKTGEIGEITQHNGYVEALTRFFREHQPLPVLAEYTVFGDGYAGSFDMVCRLPALDNQLAVLDYKTSKAIYPDTAAQLAAYAHAPEYIDENDKLHPMPKIDTGVIVRFGANGEYEIQQADLDAGWQLFQAALAIHRAQQNQLLIGNVSNQHDYNGQEWRNNLIERITHIRNNNPELMEMLTANWIHNLPPLSSDAPIDRHQLAIIDRVVSRAETECEAPFNPPPVQTPTRTVPKPPKTKTTPAVSDTIEVSAKQIEQIRVLVNSAPKEVKEAIQATTKEAQKAGTTLSLNGKPTLRRVACADLMLTVFLADWTNDREYMRTLLRHHDLYVDDIGTSLGRLDLPEISTIGETNNHVQNGTAELTYNENTDQFSITESTQK
jgi:hypothetical protein